MAKAPRQPVFGEHLPELRRKGVLTQADAARARELLREGATEPGQARTAQIELGRTLRRLRRERGLSLRELAERSGFAQGRIKRCEAAASSRLQPAALSAFARALDVPETELMRFLPPPPTPSLVGRALRELRERRGWTRRELAERCGLPPDLISGYEVKGRQPNAARLKVLAQALGVPRKELSALVVRRGVERRASPFGEVIRKARLARGLTQREVEHRADLVPGALNSYESNNQVPSRQRAGRLVKRLAPVLDLDPELLERAWSQPRRQPPTAFGHHLRELRLGRGLTQEQLAQRIDCSAATVSNYERGRCYPRVNMLSALASALGVDEAEFARLLPLSSVEREPSPFARELRSQRLAKRLSPSELSQRAGIGQGAVANYEADRAYPSHRVLAALAKTLDVDPQRWERLLPGPVPVSALGQKLRQLRRQRGLGLRQLADRIGCSRRILANWELGRPTRLAPDWSATAAALGVPERQLTRLLPPAPVRPTVTPLGRKLERARRHLGFSQAELARRLGITQASISRYELGAARPSRGVLAALAETLGVPLRRLQRLTRSDPDALERIKSSANSAGARPKASRAQ